VSELEAFGVEFEEAIERVRVPAYVIDREGVIRWLNAAAQEIVGDLRGRPFTSVVAPASPASSAPSRSRMKETVSSASSGRSSATALRRGPTSPREPIPA
jgi:hypothetical protein